MERYQKIFLEFTDSYINDKRDNYNTLSLTEAEMDMLYKMSVQHSLIPIIYEELHNNNSFKDLERNTKELWKRQAVTVVMSQASHTEQFLNLYKEICEENIDCMVVKGIVCRQLYHNPDYRRSKDEDLYVKESDYIKCHKYLIKKGFKSDCADNDITEKDLKNIHVIAYTDEMTGLQIELHRTLFEEYSDAYGYIDRYFKDLFEKNKCIEISGTKVKTLQSTDNLFYLICHAYKHFIISGFGIRQLCDILLFAEKYGDEIDWQYIRKLTEEIKAEIFLANLWDIGERWLGFSKEKAGIGNSFDDIKADSENLLEDLLDAGVFGKTSDGRIYSNGMTLNAVANRESGHRKTPVVFSALFPDYGVMKRKYRILNKFPVLLPALWIYRIVMYAFQKKNSKSYDAVAIGKHRVGLMEQYGIINRH